MSGDYETHKNQQPHVSYAGNKVDLDKYALFVDGVTSDPVSYTHLTLPTTPYV